MGANDIGFVNEQRMSVRLEVRHLKSFTGDISSSINTSAKPTLLRSCLQVKFFLTGRAAACDISINVSLIRWVNKKNRWRLIDHKFGVLHYLNVRLRHQLIPVIKVQSAVGSRNMAANFERFVHTYENFFGNHAYDREGECEHWLVLRNLNGSLTETFNAVYDVENYEDGEESVKHRSRPAKRNDCLH